MSARREREPFLSAARVIGILLVVLGHSYPFGVPIPGVMEQLRSFIYAFHMPLFIFISGYLTAGNDRTAGEYIFRRCKRLLVPYFVLSLIAFVPKIMVQQYLNDSAQLSLLWLLRSWLVPRENVWGHFWYLPVLFFLGCFGALVGKWIRKKKWVAAGMLTLGFGLLFLPETTAWFALEDLRKVFFYYVLGLFLGNRTKSRTVFSSPMWIFSFPAAVGLFYLTDSVTGRALTACLMIGFILWIGTLWKAVQRQPWKTIEQYSFTIFLLSWPAQAVVEVVFNKLYALPVAACMVCMFGAGIMVPLACVALISFVGRKLPLGWLRIMAGM